MAHCQPWLNLFYWSLSNYLSSSESSPLFTSDLSYLPHARPLHVPCHACFLLPILSSAHVVDSILICLVLRPHSVHLSQQRAISGVCFRQNLTSTLSAEFTDPSLKEDASISDVSISPFNISSDVLLARCLSTVYSINITL